MKSNDSPLVITPEVKVGELLDHYPDLEMVLLELSPTFKKLQNPVLRRTVAKVTTLKHAAKVGGLDLGRLINELRSSVGQEKFHAESNSEKQQGKPPSWLVVDQITLRIDVRPMLESGEKPVGKVMSELAKVPEGRICELTASFLPAPMIEMAEKKGFESWSKEESGNLIKVYLYRKPVKESGELVALE